METEELVRLRQQIDQIDDELLELLIKRFGIVKQVGEYKKKQNLPIVNETREEEVLKRLKQKAEEQNSNPEQIEKIWREIINSSYILEK